MGLPVARPKILTYAVSGFCSAVAGVVYTFYTQSGDPTACVGLELDAIAAVVIGGTLLSGAAGPLRDTPTMCGSIAGLPPVTPGLSGSTETRWCNVSRLFTTFLTKSSHTIGTTT